MSDRKKSQNELSFAELQRFLTQVGFNQPVKVNNSLAFQHAVSGTIIALTIPTDSQTVRSADLLSLLMRLESDGLVDDSTLRQLRSGTLPLAS